MGFYFRKSVGFGPFRLNFSKSGIGASFGVRGARISAGPRGTYINVGRNGFYYRQRIDSSSSGGSDPSANPEPVNLSDQGSRIDSADVGHLVDSSSEELVNQINTCAARLRYAPILAVAVIVLALLYLIGVSSAEQSATDAYSSAARTAGERLQAAEQAQKASINMKLKPNDRKRSEQQYKSLEAEAENASDVAKVKKAEMEQLGRTLRIVDTLGIVLGGMCAFAIVIVHRSDVLARHKPVTYALDELANDHFKILEEGCEKLARANRVWRVETQQATSDWKRNAGANALVCRRDCRIDKVQPPHIATNLVPWSIDCNDMRLFFLPDHIFVLQQHRYGMLSYKSLSVDLSATNFRETDRVPSDAKIVGRAWLYVNKNGGPDRRFGNNREMPIAAYAQVDIRSPQGFHILLHISNGVSATAFVATIQEYGRVTSQQSEKKASEDHEPKSRRTQRKPAPDHSNKSAYKTLGVAPGASKEEIKAAYYRMAQQYHPDKVATLAPEFHELAERRMKEINDAYQQLQTSV